MAKRIEYDKVSENSVMEFNENVAALLGSPLRRNFKVIAIVPMHAQASDANGVFTRWQATIFWEVEE